MPEAKMILNVPQMVMERALKLTVPADHPALKALDDKKDVVLIETNLYLAADYAAAIGNEWCRRTGAPTAYFTATEWHRYERNDDSPTDYHDSFRDFLLKPDLLIMVGLSYMKTAAAMSSMDAALNRRVQAGKRTLISGWNMPVGEFKFQTGQEMAADSMSRFPLLHQRAVLPDLTLLTSFKEE